MFIEGVNTKFIVHIVLMARQLKMKDDILLGHQNTLQRGIDLKYPLLWTEMITYAVRVNTYYSQCPNMVSGFLPKRIVIAFYEKHGSVKKKLYNLQHFRILCPQLRKNGTPMLSQP